MLDNLTDEQFENLKREYARACIAADRDNGDQDTGINDYLQEMQPLSRAEFVPYVDDAEMLACLVKLVKEEEKTYAIWRHYKDINKPKEFRRGGLTRAEAVEHCSDPRTSGDGWFDGFDEE